MYFLDPLLFNLIAPASSEVWTEENINVPECFAADLDVNNRYHDYLLGPHRALQTSASHF